MVNIVYIHSTFIFNIFSDHPGYLCAHNTDVLISLAESDIQSATELTQICPIQVIELGVGEGAGEGSPNHAMMLRLLPSERADLFIAGYSRVLLSNMGLLLFCNFALTLIILKTIDGEAHWNSNLLHVSVQDGNKKNYDRIPIVGSVRILWILASVSFVCSYYATVALSRPSGGSTLLSAYILGGRVPKPPLYKLPP
jgi:hypothetical protein